MRLCRILAVLGLLAALSLPAAASAAETKSHVGLHDMTCTSITAMGKGLSPNAALGLGLALMATATRRERILARVAALESGRVRAPR